jgi:hypothetical protein
MSPEASARPGNGYTCPEGCGSSRRFTVTVGNGVDSFTVECCAQHLPEVAWDFAPVRVDTKAP